MPREQSENDKENDSADQENRALQKALHAAKMENRRLLQRLADSTNQAAGDDDDDGDDDAQPPNRKRKKATALPESDNDELTALQKPPRKRARRKNQVGDALCNDGPHEDTPHPDDADGEEPEQSASRTPSPSPPPASRRVPSPAEIQEWGKKFVINYSPWLIDDSVFSLKLKPGIGDKHSTRFVKKENKFLVENLLQGQLRDLLKIIPKECQWLREQKDFQTHFNYGMQSIRQAWSKRLRSQGTEKIFGARADDMDGSKERFDAFAEFIGYDAALAAKGAPYSALRAPILHTRVPTDKSFKKQDVFTRKELKTTWIGLLRGAPAAKHFRMHGRSTNVPAKSYQSIFHIRNATHAHPAAAAVLTCWALSADTELTRSGDQTEIDWLEHFHEYLSVIHRGIEGKCAYTRKMFREWDGEVFNTAHSPLGGDGPVDAVTQSEEHDEAMAQYDEPDDEGEQLEENRARPEENDEPEYEEEDS